MFTVSIRFILATQLFEQSSKAVENWNLNLVEVLDKPAVIPVLDFGERAEILQPLPQLLP